MTSVDFPGRTVIIARDQPEYLPLFARVDGGQPQCEATFCWRLTWRERLRLLVTGRLWHHVWTFRQPLQPQRLSVDEPKYLRKSRSS